MFFFQFSCFVAEMLSYYELFKFGFCSSSHQPGSTYEESAGDWTPSRWEIHGQAMFDAVRRGWKITRDHIPRQKARLWCIHEMGWGRPSEDAPPGILCFFQTWKVDSSWHWPSCQVYHSGAQNEWRLQHLGHLDFFVDLFWLSFFEWVPWCSVIQGMALVICPNLSRGRVCLVACGVNIDALKTNLSQWAWSSRMCQVAFDLTDTHGNRTLTL